MLHGFLRAPNGSFTTIDAPGSVGTFPSSINPAGAITGLYLDVTGSVVHAFLRAPNGSFTTFDAPGSLYQTQPTSINPSGAITGYYYDWTSHGFLWSH